GHNVHCFQKSHHLMLWSSASSSSWKYTTSGTWLPQAFMTASWTRSENHEQTKLGALDETQPSRRPIVAPLNGLVNASGGLHSRASYTPRSAPRTMRASWPSLEIGRADVEAMDWWFSEFESQLANAVPDSRCLYPWLQQAPDFKEVEKELSGNFTFKDFKQGWNFMDFSNFSVWYEEQARRSSMSPLEAEPSWPPILEADLQGTAGAAGASSSSQGPGFSANIPAPKPLRFEQKDSRRSSETRTSVGCSVGSTSSAPGTTSLTPRLCEHMPVKVSSGDMQQSREGRCHSAR
ncbi:unnamed protein product, partial [Durusdinium trenchii]